MSEQTKPSPAATLTCPACGLVIVWRWEADLVFKDPDETVTYCQCNRCSHLWVTGRAT